MRRKHFFLGLMLLPLLCAGVAAQQDQLLSSIKISVSTGLHGSDQALISSQLLEITQKPGRITLRQTDVSCKTEVTDEHQKREYEVITSEGVVPAKVYAALWAELESQGVWKMKAANLGYNINETNPSKYTFAFQKGKRKNSFSDHGVPLWEKYGKTLKPISALFNKYAEPIELLPARPGQ
jgi:hypothetical protein